MALQRSPYVFWLFRFRDGTRPADYPRFGVARFLTAEACAQAYKGCDGYAVQFQEVIHADA